MFELAQNMLRLGDGREGEGGNEPGSSAELSLTVPQLKCRAEWWAVHHSAVCVFGDIAGVSPRDILF